MDPNTRGVLLVALSMGALAAALALTWPRRAAPPAPSEDASPAPLGSHRAVVPASRVGCKRLATRYADRWSEAAACKTDGDCVAETRGGMYSSLDGCVRAGNPRLSHEAADAVEKQWLQSSCAWAMDECPASAGAQCRDGECVERPPAPLPPDWTRIALPGVATMFAPPDLKRVEAQPIDSYMAVFEGKRRTLTLDFTDYGAPLDLDAAPEPGRPSPLRARSIVVQGPRGARRETMALFERRATSGPSRFEAVLSLGDVACSGVMLLLGSQATLNVTLACDRREDCADAEAMFASIALVSSAPERKADAGR